MSYSKCVAAFRELQEYNAYFRFEFGYTRTTGWTLFIGNSNTGIITSICALGAERPASLWKQAAPVLAQLKATYINTDGTPNWTMQKVKNSLFAICPAERLGKICKIKEEGFLLRFSAQELEFTLDAANPDLPAFKVFVDRLV